MAFKLGENLRGMVTWATLALSTLAATHATAEGVNNKLSATYESMFKANEAAKASWMVLARAYNGEMRIVTSELAKLLDTQGFRYSEDGTLYGYESGAIFDGWNFNGDSNYLQTNSTKIRVESKSDSDKKQPDDGGGCTWGGCNPGEV